MVQENSQEGGVYKEYAKAAKLRVYTGRATDIRKVC